jgi:N-acetylmuramoyl-L-alanine amidase
MTETAAGHIVERPSPNHGPRPDGAVVDMLVLHYTGMRSATEALERLCDPASEVSAHYLIDEDGTIFRLVDEARRAWHAGRGAWAGTTDINSCSIGIELANRGHEFGYHAFPEPQMRALERLCHDLLARHPIPAHRILGHSDVAPDRKEDPGELFGWPRLARAGIGIWPEITPPPGGFKAGSIEDIRRDLASLGYRGGEGEWTEAEMRSALLAFQRHWLPANMSGARDRETAWRLRNILSAFEAAEK